MYNKVHLCNRDLLVIKQKQKHIGYYALLKLITIVLVVLMVLSEGINKTHYFYALVITFLMAIEQLIMSIVPYQKT